MTEKEDPKDWGVRRSYIQIIGDILELALVDTNKPKEGIWIEDQENSSTVINMTHLTSLFMNTEDLEGEDIAAQLVEKQQE